MTDRRMFPPGTPLSPTGWVVVSACGRRTDRRQRGEARKKRHCWWCGEPCPGLFTGGLTWRPTGDVLIPGYIFRHDGKIDLNCPVPAENVLKAERDCVVDKLLAQPGESLAVDQAIIGFK